MFAKKAKESFDIGIQKKFTKLHYLSQNNLPIKNVHLFNPITLDHTVGIEGSLYIYEPHFLRLAVEGTYARLDMAQ